MKSNVLKLALMGLLAGPRITSNTDASSEIATHPQLQLTCCF